MIEEKDIMYIINRNLCADTKPGILKEIADSFKDVLKESEIKQLEKDLIKQGKIYSIINTCQSVFIETTYDTWQDFKKIYIFIGIKKDGINFDVENGCAVKLFLMFLSKFNMLILKSVTCAARNIRKKDFLDTVLNTKDDNELINYIFSINNSNN